MILDSWAIPLQESGYGLLDAELGRLYEKLFDKGQKDVYTDLVFFDPNEVHYRGNGAREFLENGIGIVRKELDRH